jgi:membrane protein DedA with SNARE-associated domain
MERLQFFVSLIANSDGGPRAAYAAVLVALLGCGFGVPVPEDLILVAGGVLAGLGVTDLRVMMAVGLTGVLVGDATVFLLGRAYGERVRRLPLVRRLLTPERYAAVQEKFRRHGSRVLVVARFLPGLRAPIFLTAGMSRTVPFWRFALLDGVAALVSVPLWIVLGYLGANNRVWLAEWLHRSRTGMTLLVAVVVLVCLVAWHVRRRRETASLSQS